MSTYNFVLNQLYSQLYKIGFRVRVPQNTGSTTDSQHGTVNLIANYCHTILTGK